MEVKVEDQSSKKVSSFLQLMTTSLSWRKIGLRWRQLFSHLWWRRTMFMLKQGLVRSKEMGKGLEAWKRRLRMK